MRINKDGTLSFARHPESVIGYNEKEKKLMIVDVNDPNRLCFELEPSL